MNFMRYPPPADPLRHRMWKSAGWVAANGASAVHVCYPIGDLSGRGEFDVDYEAGLRELAPGCLKTVVDHVGEWRNRVVSTTGPDGKPQVLMFAEGPSTRIVFGLN